MFYWRGYSSCEGQNVLKDTVSFQRLTAENIQDKPMTTYLCLRYTSSAKVHYLSQSHANVFPDYGYDLQTCLLVLG